MMRWGLWTACALGLSLGCDRGARPTATAYVSNETAGEIDIIDVGRGVLVDRIPVGKRPRGLRLSHDGALLYVALSGSPIAGPHVDRSKLPPPDRTADGIAVIDLAQRRVVRQIVSGPDPESFDLSRDGKKLYVSNEEHAELSIVDLATNRITKTLPVGGEPEGVTTRPDGGVVYVTSEEDGVVTVIDTASETVVARADVGARPRVVLFTPDSKRAFVSAEQAGWVTVMDAQTHAVVDRQVLPPKSLPMGLSLSPDGDRLYVATGRGGQVVALGVGEPAAEPHVIREVGARPWGIAATANGLTLLTANGPSGDVSLIETRSGAIRRRVATGGSPWGVVLAESLR